MNTDQEESAVVEKKDASTQTEFEKEERPRSRASDDYDSDDVPLESSDGSYTDIHELDPDYNDPCYPSQVCFGLHGVSYTPPGWRRRRVKRKTLMIRSKESEEDNTQSAWCILHSSRVATAKSEAKDARVTHNYMHCILFRGVLGLHFPS